MPHVASPNRSLSSGQCALRQAASSSAVAVAVAVLLEVRFLRAAPAAPAVTPALLSTSSMVLHAANSQSSSAAANASAGVEAGAAMAKVWWRVLLWWWRGWWGWSGARGWTWVNAFWPDGLVGGCAGGLPPCPCFNSLLATMLFLSLGQWACVPQGKGRFWEGRGRGDVLVCVWGSDAGPRGLPWEWMVGQAVLWKPCHSTHDHPHPQQQLQHTARLVDSPTSTSGYSHPPHTHSTNRALKRPAGTAVHGRRFLSLI